MTTEQKIEKFTARLLAEFWDWSYEEAHHAAARIVEAGEAWAFEMEAQRGIAEIPTTTRRAAA